MIPVLLGALVANPIAKAIGVNPIVAGAIGIGGVLAANALNNKEDVNECTVAETASLLGISEYTVKKKIRDGELAGHIVGKKYMVPIESINEYSQRVGKSGQILGQQSQPQLQQIPKELRDSLKNLSEEIWNDSTLLQDFIDSTRLQQEIKTLEREKLELSKEIATKNGNIENDIELSQQIMDKKIQELQLAQAIKICEAQIHYLEKLPQK